MMNKEKLIARINETLEIMEQKGYDKVITHDGINHYEELKRKRDAIILGYDYKIIDMAQTLLASYGALMCSLNIYHGGRYYPTEELVKGVEKSIENFKEEYFHGKVEGNQDDNNGTDTSITR